MFRKVIACIADRKNHGRRIFVREVNRPALEACLNGWRKTSYPEFWKLQTEAYLWCNGEEARGLIQREGQ